MAIYAASFPARERLPEALVRERIGSGFYALHTARDGSRTAAFALTVELMVGIVHLDYMATDAPLRCRGIGKRLLDGIRNGVLGPGEILTLELEDPDRTPGVDRELARRRLAFYIRNGAVISDADYFLPSIGGSGPTPMRLAHIPAGGAPGAPLDAGTLAAAASAIHTRIHKRTL